MFWKCTPNMNIVRSAFLPHKEALISRMARNRRHFFPHVERTPRRVSRLSRFAAELHSTNCNLPLFLDSLICPTYLLLSSYPACTSVCLPIAGPSFSFQDNLPPELSVTFTCRVFSECSFRENRCNLVNKNEEILCERNTAIYHEGTLSLSIQDFITHYIKRRNSFAIINNRKGISSSVYYILKSRNVNLIQKNLKSKYYKIL